MSGINGLGGHLNIQQPAASAPTAAAPAPSASSGSSNPLEAIQSLMKQLESSANTRAIPAHQNW